VSSQHADSDKSFGVDPRRRKVSIVKRDGRDVNMGRAEGNMSEDEFLDDKD
jgi:hypothetical protein